MKTIDDAEVRIVDTIRELEDDTMEIRGHYAELNDAGRLVATEALLGIEGGLIQLHKLLTWLRQP